MGPDLLRGQPRVPAETLSALEVDKKNVPEAQGILRFEIQLRKKSRYLQHRLREKQPTVKDVLQPSFAYACLVETLNSGVTI